MDEDLDRLVDALASKGIRYVTDTLAADVSMTDSVYWGSGWCWDDTPYSFQPYLSPLMLNRGCVDVSVSPDHPECAYNLPVREEPNNERRFPNHTGR